MTILIHGTTVITADEPTACSTMRRSRSRAGGSPRSGRARRCVPASPPPSAIDGAAAACCRALPTSTRIWHDAGARHLRGPVAAAPAALHRRAGAACRCRRSTPEENARDGASSARWRRSAAARRRLLEDGADIEAYVAAMAETGVRILLTERAWDRAGRRDRRPRAVRASDRALASAASRASRLARAPGTARPMGASASASPPGRPTCVRRNCCGRLAELQRPARYRGHHPPQPDLGRGRRGPGASRPAADRISGRSRAFCNDRLICAHCRCMAPREEELLGTPGPRCRSTRPSPRGAACQPAHRGAGSAGCRIGMGTDNMAEDMVEVMRTGLFMERVRREDGRQPTPEQALRWATRNGYRGDGDARWRRAGAGQQGRPGDDPHRPAASGAPPAAGRRPSSTRDRPPISTASWWMARWVMRDGRVLTMDEPRIVAEADRIARRAWARLFAERPDLAVPPGFVPGP